MSTIVMDTTFIISETVRDRGLVPKDRQQKMAYGVSNVLWGSTVSYPNDSLASCFYFLLFLMCHFAVNWCDKLYVFAFIFAVLSPV